MLALVAIDPVSYEIICVIMYNSSTQPPQMKIVCFFSDDTIHALPKSRQCLLDARRFPINSTCDNDVCFVNVTKKKTEHCDLVDISSRKAKTHP